MQTDTLPTAAERVAAGAAWLDSQIDAAYWYRRIDLNRLEIRCPRRCVLGQIYGDYYDAPIGPAFAITLGFDGDDVPETDALTEAWTRLIDARTNVAVIADGIDYGIECAACGHTERNVATTEAEARQVADRHACPEES